MKLSFREFLKNNSILKPNIWESELTQSDGEQFFVLPICNGKMSNDQVKQIKEILSFYLDKFNMEVVNQNSKIQVDENGDVVVTDFDDCQIGTPDAYIDLSFGVVDREDNALYCTYEDGTFYTPSDMNSILARKILANINLIKEVDCVTQVKPDDNPKFSVAYEVVMDNIIVQRRRLNNIGLYLKFDFRKNEKDWDKEQHCHRYSAYNDRNQKTVAVPKNNSKVCFISLHDERN